MCIIYINMANNPSLTPTFAPFKSGCGMCRASTDYYQQPQAGGSNYSNDGLIPTSTGKNFYKAPNFDVSDSDIMKNNYNKEFSTAFGGKKSMSKKSTPKKLNSKKKITKKKMKGGEYSAYGDSDNIEGPNTNSDVQSMNIGGNTVPGTFASTMYEPANFMKGGKKISHKGGFSDMPNEEDYMMDSTMNKMDGGKKKHMKGGMSNVLGEEQYGMMDHKMMDHKMMDHKMMDHKMMNSKMNGMMNSKMNGMMNSKMNGGKKKHMKGGMSNVLGEEQYGMMDHKMMDHKMMDHKMMNSKMNGMMNSKMNGMMNSKMNGMMNSKMNGMMNSKMNGGKKKHMKGGMSNISSDGQYDMMNGYDKMNGMMNGYDKMNGMMNGYDKMNGMMDGYDKMNGMMNGYDKMNGMMNGYDKMNGMMDGYDKMNGMMNSKMNGGKKKHMKGGMSNISSDGQYDMMNGKMNGMMNGYDKMNAMMDGYDKMNGMMNGYDKMNGMMNGYDKMNAMMNGAINGEMDGMMNGAMYGGSKNKLNKKQKGGMETNGATPMNQRFYDVNATLDNYTENSGNGIMSAYGPIESGNVGTGMLAPYTSSTCLTANHNTGMKTGGSKTSSSKKKLNKKQKGGMETNGATPMNQRFYDVNATLDNYAANSGNGIMSAYGPIESGNVGTGMLAPYTSSTCLTANHNTGMKTGGSKTSSSKNKLNKKQKGGMETSGATPLPQRYFDPNMTQTDYPMNSGKDYMSAYGKIEPNDIGSGMLAPYTMSNSPYTSMKTGGSKKKNIKGGDGPIPAISPQPISNVQDKVVGAVNDFSGFMQKLDQDYLNSISQIENIKIGHQRLIQGGKSVKKMSDKMKLVKKMSDKMKPVKKMSDKMKPVKKMTDKMKPVKKMSDKMKPVKKMSDKKKKMKGGDGSDFALTLNSRGPSNYPDSMWGVDGETWFRQFNKTGQYIPNSQLANAATPMLAGTNDSNVVSGYNEADISYHQV